MPMDVQFEGLIAAPLTPFTNEGNLHLEAIREYSEHLRRTGVRGVFGRGAVAGATGEGLVMTLEERKKLASEWVRVAKQKLDYVIVNVGTENQRNTLTLAKHAEEIGATAIGVLPPSFVRPSSPEALVEYLKTIGQAAPRTPLIYYHLPTMTHVQICMEDFLKAADGNLPTLCGMKYSSFDLMDFGRCLVHNGGKYQIIYGADEQSLGALAMGARAFIGSTYNYAGNLYNRMIEAFNKGDLQTARKEQYKSQALVRILKKYGGTNAVQKEIMRIRGLDMGPVRSPVLPMNETQRAALKKDLLEAGFLNWC